MPEPPWLAEACPRASPPHLHWGPDLEREQVSFQVDLLLLLPAPSLLLVREQGVGHLVLPDRAHPGVHPFPLHQHHQDLSNFISAT